MTFLEKISLSVKEEKISWKKHALVRMFERGISREEVKYVILNGEVIENYSEDYPFPSVLIAYVSNGHRPLHVVASYNDSHCYVITAYEPDEKRFENNLKNRRSNEND